MDDVMGDLDGRRYPLCNMSSSHLCMAVMSRQGRSLDVSLVINPQGQNKKARVLSASYEE